MMRNDMNPEINTFFGRVVVINLKARADRLAEMKEQLRRIGLCFDSANMQLFESTKPSDAAGFSSVGAHGCFMSHLAVLRAACEDHVNALLILEDDVNFCHDFNLKFAAVASFLEATDWGMLYGSYWLSRRPNHFDWPCTRAASQLDIGTSAFLAINGQHIAALVSYLQAMLTRAPGDPQGGPMHIDGAYNWFRQSQPDMVTWLASPALGFQRSSRTDVHPLRWFDKLRWTAVLISKIRQWRNGLRRGAGEPEPG